MKNRRIIYLCFFLSGAAALMYEIIWTRYFSLTFGGTTYSITTVLSAFMAGLALGSLVFGRIADRVKNRLRLYGWIELIIGIYALIFPYLYRVSSDFYLSIVIDSGMGQFEKLALKFVLSFLIMLVPTTLMGGSLPILSRFFIRTSEEVSSKLGLLYSLNTFGAVIGTYLVGFHMIAKLGISNSVLIAAALNIGIGVVMILIYSGTGEDKAAAKEERPAEGPPLTGRERLIIIFAVSAFMISGFVALSHEVVWTRILSLVIGSSTYAFTMILIGFLIGIALGSYLISHTKWIPNKRINLAFFSWIQIGIGFSAYMLIPLFSKLPHIMVKAFEINPESYGFITFYQFILALLIMIVPTTLMGATLPVIGKIVSREVGTVGRSIGNIYFFNTFGAIFGAFFAGFVFIPYLGTLSTLKLGIYINVLLGIGGILLATHQQKQKRQVLISLLIACLGLLLVRYSSWNQNLMDSGVSIYGMGYAEKGTGNKRFKDGSKQVFFHEGVNATITVRKKEGEIYLKTNGKSDASMSIVDMSTQTLSGHLPILLHPDPKDILVIGLGSGVTAGTVSQYDSIKSVDVAEIESAVVEASDYFKEVNHGVMESDKISMFINDGRNHLMETRKTYDIIISEPPNPWISGVASLFTKDFFQLVNEKLKPDGIFCQWVQMYNMSPEDLKMILNTLSSSFEDVQFWMSTLGDFLVIASDSKIHVDPLRIKQVFGLNQDLRDDFFKYIRADHTVEVIGRLFFDKPAIIDYSEGAQINSDNHPYLEFRAPKSIYLQNEAELFFELLKKSAKYGEGFLKNIKDPEDIALIYFHRSKLASNLIKWNEMSEFYIQAALALDKNREEFYFQLGAIYFLQNKYEEAKEAVLKGLAINKTSAGIMNLVDILIAMGKHDEAISILESNRNIMNDFEFKYAFVLHEAGKYQQAFPYYKEALDKRQGKEYVLLRIVGNYYAGVNQPEKAEYYYLQSLEKEEMNKDALILLAQLYLKQGRHEDKCKVLSFLDQYWEIDDIMRDRLAGCNE